MTADDFIFWTKIKEAFDEAVIRQPDTAVSFTLNTRRVDIEVMSKTTVIIITEVDPPEPLPLIVPPGSMTKDPRDT